jgi:hypothetical protein
MTKEQIYEKITVITTGPNCIADMKVDAEKLASYLATIEERLKDFDNYRNVLSKYCGCGCHTPTPTECEHKHRGLYGECLKCTAKFDDSPTEVKDAKPETGAVRNLRSHDEYEYYDGTKWNLETSWEKEFDEKFNTDYYDICLADNGKDERPFRDGTKVTEEIKSFIRNLIK